MKAIFNPYASFAMMGLVLRKVNTFLRTANGMGMRTATNVIISVTRRANVRV